MSLKDISKYISVYLTDSVNKRGYYLAHGQPGEVIGDCLSNVSSGMTLTYASTPFMQSTAWTTVTTALTQSSTVGAIAVVGWNVRRAIPAETTTTSSSSVSASSGTSGATPASASASATNSGQLLVKFHRQRPSQQVLPYIQHPLLHHQGTVIYQPE